MRRLLAFVATAAAVFPQGDPAALAFRPMRLFGDHMVLPAARRVPVWGVGVAGTPVEARGSWGGVAAGAVGSDGRWRLEIETPPRGGPFELVLVSGGARRELRDVLVGDVWLGSGQSNMEMPVGEAGGWRGGVQDWQREVAAADHPQLRVFTVAQRTSGAPLDDVDGQWQVCSPTTAGAFSASAYFFGRELLQRGKGPIGLVVSAWGGTVCEAWASETALVAFPEFGPALAATKAVASKSSFAERQQAFWSGLPAAPPPGAATAVEVPDLWSKSGLADRDGVAFYRRTVVLPPAFAGQELWLELGAIDDMDTVWCNGDRVGGMERDGAWSTARRYRLTAPRAAVGHERRDLDLLVRVVDTGGEGGFTSPAAAIRLVLASDEQQQLPLAGTWSRCLGPKLGELPPWPRREDGNPNRPAVLWNGMVAPLVPFPFAGAIWYQGESNRGRPDQYARLFPAMIADWRRAFAVPLPFYFVQIAPFGYGDRSDETPRLREAQAAALALPHTGMVVTLDVGDVADIHPRDKQSVGLRLALQALRDHYGEPVASDGPRPSRIARDGQAVRIVFDGADGGLAAAGELGGFELAGTDGVFAAATAQIAGDAVVLQCASVPAPAHVRYAWSEAPKGVLRSRTGLPAWPFRAQVQ